MESSPESPAWGAYLSSVDREVVVGLKSMVLTAIGTLTHRAQQYEQVREGVEDMIEAREQAMEYAWYGLARRYTVLPKRF